MSAFIVNDKTINRMVGVLENNLYGSTILSSEIQRALEDFDINLFDNQGRISDKKLNVFANSLMTLNKHAVDYRYNENGIINLIEYNYEPCSLIQVLKSIHCFLYQCSEGEQFENSKLYKFIARIRDVLESHIIHELPEYQNAEWD